MSNFHVGQKVVCISSDDQAPKGYTVVSYMDKPEVGRIYTVRAVVIGIKSGKACVRLVEIQDQAVRVREDDGGIVIGDVVFHAACFRPVVERKTDISIFTAMLTGKKAKVGA